MSARPSCALGGDVAGAQRPDGIAWLVVAKHLGGFVAGVAAGTGWTVDRHASQKGYRILRVSHESLNATTTPDSRQNRWQGYVDVAEYLLAGAPDGRVLFRMSFRVGGAPRLPWLARTGKQDHAAADGRGRPRSRSGRWRDPAVSVMRQFIGMIGHGGGDDAERRGHRTRRRSHARRIRRVAEPDALAQPGLDPAEPPTRRRAWKRPSSPTRTRCTRGEIGGYDAEILFDTVAERDGQADDVRDRLVSCPVRRPAEAIRAGDAAWSGEVLCWTAGHFLDVPGARWLERLPKSPKSVLYVSHDRAAARPHRRPGGRGRGQFRVDIGRIRVVARGHFARHGRLEARRRWDEEHEKPPTDVDVQAEGRLQPGDGSRYQARSHVWRVRGDGPPPLPPRIRTSRCSSPAGVPASVRSSASRSTDRRLSSRSIWRSGGDRVAVLGANGTGKSHFAAAGSRRYRPDPAVVRRTRRSQAWSPMASRSWARVIPPLLTDPRSARSRRTHARRASGAATTPAVIVGCHARAGRLTGGQGWRSRNCGRQQHDSSCCRTRWSDAAAAQG